MLLPITSVTGAATRLLEWIRQAEQDAPKPMRGFACSLRQDPDAVLSGVTSLGGPAVRGRAVALGLR
ncbi:hypothetical protein ACWCQW_07270 [Streptomyces mirabilis]